MGGILIGVLNKRITIQTSTRTSDGMGGFSTIWVEVRKVWAAIWPISANELTQSMQGNLEITHRVRIRHIASFRPEYRILFGTRYFNIISIINPGERNEFLDLMCKEVL